MAHKADDLLSFNLPILSARTEQPTRLKGFRCTMQQRRPLLLASASNLSPRAKPIGPTQVDTQLASTIAGIASRILLHPIDCVKTRLQHLRGRPGSVDTNATILKFIAKEGIPGLYRGIFSALAGVVPYSMCTFEFLCLRQTRRTHVKLTFYIYLIVCTGQYTCRAMNLLSCS